MSGVPKLSKEQIQEFINVSKDFYGSMDPSFFWGFANVFKHISSKVESARYTDNPKQEYPIENTPQIIEEFFNSLSPMFGEAAHNHLQKINYYMSPEIASKEDLEFDKQRKYSDKKIMSFEYSNLNSFTLEGNYRDVIVGAHEVTHRFIPSYAIPTEVTSNTLREAATLYIELLCADFIKDNYKQDVSGMYNFRLVALKDSAESRDFCRETNNIEALKGFADYLEFIQNNELDDSNVADFEEQIQILDKKINNGKGDIVDQKLFVLSAMPEKFNYDFQFVYANFLYQEAQKSPERKVEIFEQLLKILSYTKGFEDEQLQAIEEFGLPIVKNGKIALAENTVEAFCQAFDKTHEEFKSRENKKQESNLRMKDVVKNAVNGMTREEGEKARMIEEKTIEAEEKNQEGENQR